GCLPLVLGMPVVLLQNFDVPGGVVNGSHGTLTSIKYSVNYAGEREASSCTIKLIDSSVAEPMYSLSKDEAPVTADSITIQVSEEH
ncbi:hypothetical protein HYPSUDRAFT_125352, partial [Hypholoma sublateritium FD-334 SS-4]